MTHTMRESFHKPAGGTPAWPREWQDWVDQTLMSAELSMEERRKALEQWNPRRPTRAAPTTAPARSVRPFKTASFKSRAWRVASGRRTINACFAARRSMTDAVCSLGYGRRRGARCLAAVAALERESEEQFVQRCLNLVRSARRFHRCRPNPSMCLHWHSILEFQVQASKRDSPGLSRPKIPRVKCARPNSRAMTWQTLMGFCGRIRRCI